MDSTDAAQEIEVRRASVRACGFAMSYFPALL